MALGGSRLLQAAPGGSRRRVCQYYAPPCNCHGAGPMATPWGQPHGYSMGPAPWLLHGASILAPWGSHGAGYPTIREVSVLAPWLLHGASPMATPWGQYLDPMEKTMGMVPCKPWGRLTGCECESTIVKHVSGAEGKNPS